MGQVFGLKLSRSERDVLVALADHANDDGTSARPSVGLLAWKIGLSPRQVQRVIGQLEKRGLITAVAHRNGGRGRATEYRIDLSHAERKPLYNSRPKDDIRPSPFIEKKGDISDPERVTSGVEKGDISSAKGDIQVSPQPSLEPPPERTAKCVSRAAARSRLKQITPGFTISPELKSWASEHCPQLGLEPQTRRFVLYYTAKGQECVDWDAKWKLWMLDASERQRAGPQHRFLSSAERSEARLRERDYEADGQALAGALAAERAAGKSRFD